MIRCDQRPRLLFFLVGFSGCKYVNNKTIVYSTLTINPNRVGESNIQERAIPPLHEEKE